MRTAKVSCNYVIVKVISSEVHVHGRVQVLCGKHTNN